MENTILPWWEMLLRLGLAIALGGLIGVNRERAHKPAGVKTLVMVCLGSALIMIISIEMFILYASQSNTVDPGRIAAQVVTGVGFLGAGTIIHAEGGFVRGLTTAASIWVVAGIGLACGSGMYVLALLATGLTVTALALINSFMRSTSKRVKQQHKND